jgi:hypothetical protein
MGVARVDSDWGCKKWEKCGRGGRGWNGILGGGEMSGRWSVEMLTASGKRVAAITSWG